VKNKIGVNYIAGMSESDKTTNIQNIKKNNHLSDRFLSSDYNKKGGALDLFYNLMYNFDFLSPKFASVHHSFLPRFVLFFKG
jgi:hypothetical protein